MEPPDRGNVILSEGQKLFKTDPVRLIWEVDMQSAEKYRESFLKGDTARDEGLTTPEDIVRTDDVSYGADAALVTDIYRRSDMDGRNPTIVSVHGGAWVAGSKTTYQYYCMSLAQRGFTVVNCNYHMAPETQFPGSIADINQLFAWIMANGAQYHIDTRNLFVVSDSSGAQITSQYAALLTNPEFQKLFPFTPPEGLALNAIALNCGVYDAKTYILTDADAPIHYYVGELTEEKLEAMNTMKYITSAFPPAYVVSSNRDFLRRNAQPMYEALQALGVESRLQMFGTQERPLGHVFHLDIRCPEGIECSDNETAFFRQFIVA